MKVLIPSIPADAPDVSKYGAAVKALLATLDSEPDDLSRLMLLEKTVAKHATVISGAPRSVLMVGLAIAVATSRDYYLAALDQSGNPKQRDRSRYAAALLKRCGLSGHSSAVSRAVRSGELALALAALQLRLPDAAESLIRLLPLQQLPDKTKIEVQVQGWTDLLAAAAGQLPTLAAIKAYVRERRARKKLNVKAPPSLPNNALRIVTNVLTALRQPNPDLDAARQTLEELIAHMQAESPEDPAPESKDEAAPVLSAVPSATATIHMAQADAIPPAHDQIDIGDVRLERAPSEVRMRMQHYSAPVITAIRGLVKPGSAWKWDPNNRWNYLEVDDLAASHAAYAEIQAWARALTTKS